MLIESVILFPVYDKEVSENHTAEVGKMGDVATRRGDSENKF